MTTVAKNPAFTITNSDPVRFISEAERIVVGQLGQTLDGRIATSTGDSKYINSECGLRHLHRLRSAVDAVVVGVGSVNADDPNLTVRLCDGEHPVRVIIDPKGRVDLGSRLFGDDLGEIVIVTALGVDHPAKKLARIVHLPALGGNIEPKEIVAALNGIGLKRLLIEGGNCTLSRFIDAKALDRLHLIVAPMILGAGLPGIELSPIDKLGEAMKPEVMLYPLGRDLVFDCNLSVTRQG